MLYLDTVAPQGQVYSSVLAGCEAAMEVDLNDGVPDLDSLVVTGHTASNINKKVNTSSSMSSYRVLVGQLIGLDEKRRECRRCAPSSKIKETRSDPWYHAVQ